jgi:hypothetical protein
MEKNTVVVSGEKESPEERKRMEELNKYFSGLDLIRSYEDFAKWIFGSTAIIASLGAGLSNAAFANLSGCGTILFALAIFSVGVSLACAVLSLTPLWKPQRFNPNNFQQMMLVLETQLNYRRRRIQIAAIAFAIGLILAAAAPAASSLACHGKQQAHVYVTYDLNAQGKFESRLSAVGLEPYTPVEIELQWQNAKHIKMTMPKYRGVADVNGIASFNLTLPNANKVKDILVITRWNEAAGKREESLNIPVRGDP